MCFVIPTISSGGIETYLLRFLRYLDGEFEVSVIVRGGKEGELYDTYKKANVNLWFMPLGYLNPFRSYRYFRLFKNQKFDVVCDFNANFAGVTMLVARAANIEKRITFYRQGEDHFESGFFRNSVNRVLNRLVNRHATDILFNSKAAVDVFFPDRDPSDQRFEVIYNGVEDEPFKRRKSKIDARRKLRLPADKFLIGHVGRNDKVKNHKTIFETAEKLVQQKQAIHFVLCGSGTKDLLNEIRERGLSQYFSVLGYRDDLPAVLHAIDLFFFPSITEGQPNALIEAMMAGVPVMASDIAPIRECLPNEFYFCLAKPNDVDHFTKIARNIMDDDKEEWLTLVEWAKNQFDSDTNFEKFKEKIII